MKRELQIGLMLGAAVCMVTGNSPADPPRGWRGDGTGNYPDATPPLHWSTSSNVVWKTELPDWSNSSPLLLRDRIFVCSEPTTLIALSAETGEILWQRSLAYENVLPSHDLPRLEVLGQRGYKLRAEMARLTSELDNSERAYRAKPDDTKLRGRVVEVRQRIADTQFELRACEPYLAPETDPRIGMSTPTPATDGRNVYVLFGNGVAACFDRAGKMRWGRIVSHKAHPDGQRSSPLIAGDYLIIHMDQVYALNKRTGETAWQTASPPSFGSPVVVSLTDSGVILSASGDMLRQSDGLLLASRVAHLAHASPLRAEGIAYYVEQKAWAVSLPNFAEPPFSSRELWNATLSQTTTYASPVFDDGLVYTCDAKGILSVLNAGNGEIVSRRSSGLSGDTVVTALEMAGEHLFVTTGSGLTCVFSSGQTPDLLAANQLEPLRSSLLFSGSRIYVRTLKRAWCIAAP